MANLLYFGNLRHAEWVKAPAPGMGASSVGMSEELNYAGGGAFVSQTSGSHRVFEKSWPVGQQADFEFLSRFRDGDHGTGLMYWVDPMAMDLNAFPPHVARPELVSKGWPSLIGAGIDATIVESGTLRTNLSTNPSFTLGNTGWTAVNGPTFNGNGILDFTTAVAIGQVFLYQASVAIVPGDNVQGSMDVSVPLGYGAVTVRGRISYNSTSPVTVHGAEVTIQPGQTKRVMIGTGVAAGAGATAAQMYLSAPGAATVPIGSRIIVDRVLLEKNGVIGADYFDGSTVFTDTRDPSWTGAADASTSTMYQPYAGLPVKAAEYIVDTPADTVPNRRHVLIIPDTHTLWVGFSGSAVAPAVLRAQPIRRDGSYAAVQDLTLLSDGANVRLNTSWDGADYSAVIFYITQTVAGTSTIRLTSAKAVYSITGITPTLTGDHVRGYGHSGLRMSDGPTFAYIYYNEDAGKKYVSAAAKFTEVGSWI